MKENPEVKVLTLDELEQLTSLIVGEEGYSNVSLAMCASSLGGYVLA